jgi:hypothetical protein
MTIHDQLESFINSLVSFNKKREHPRDTRDYEYLMKFFHRVIQERNERSAIIKDEAYFSIAHSAYHLFPGELMFHVCMDGRVMLILMFGLPARVSRSIRTPGGMIRDFIRGTDGRLFLPKDAPYAKNLLSKLRSMEAGELITVFDSHLGCAARAVEEQEKGRNPSDAGLLADISHKLQIGHAVEEFARQHSPNGKLARPLYLSFDPHDDHMYLGLETPKARAFAEKQGGYTKEVLQTLVEKKSILSTAQLIAESAINQQMEKVAFPLDWKKQYAKSAEQFWSAMETLVPLLDPVLSPRIEHLYPQDRLNRARLVLTVANLLSSFLHTRQHPYSYGIHEEQGITITPGGYPPYPTSMFKVSVYDEQNLLETIELAEGLVRKNRAEGRVTLDLEGYTDSEKVAAPVGVLVQERVEELYPDAIWETFRAINWQDMPSAWEQMNDREFFDYLYTKMSMPSGLMIALNNLRHRMAVIYTPGTQASSHFVEHYTVALPVIIDQLRTHQAIIPFIKLGYGSH